MITHQKQPSRTSCGPTCVAMLVGKPAAEILSLLPLVRQKKQTTKHSTSVAELSRLLRSYDFILGMRWIGEDLWSFHGILRVHHRTPAGQFRQGWHWVVMSEGMIYDPSATEVIEARWWFKQHQQDKVIFYDVAPTVKG